MQRLDDNVRDAVLEAWVGINVIVYGKRRVWVSWHSTVMQVFTLNFREGWARMMGRNALAAAATSPLVFTEDRTGCLKLACCCALSQRPGSAKIHVQAMGRVPSLAKHATRLFRALLAQSYQFVPRPTFEISGAACAACAPYIRP